MNAKLIISYLMLFELFLVFLGCTTINNQPTPRQYSDGSVLQDQEQQTRYQVLIKALGSNYIETWEDTQSKLMRIGNDLVEQYKKIKGEFKVTKEEAIVKQKKLEVVKTEIAQFAKLLRGSIEDTFDLSRRLNTIREYLYGVTLPKIAFVSFEEETSPLYVMRIDSTGLKRLINHSLTHNDFPAWSPDGTMIAFISKGTKEFDAKLQNGDLYVMTADGQNLKKLAENVRYSKPNWCPDNTKIAFVSGYEDIRIIDINTGKNEFLTSGLYPRWGPDGIKIAFLSSTGNSSSTAYSIYTIRADDKDPKNLGREMERDPLFRHPFCWSPDGIKIAFASSEYKYCSIYVMDQDGNNIRRLYDIPQYEPAWSPDGKKIAFLSMEGGDTVSIMNANGTNQTRLKEFTGRDHPPCWSPDSTKLAFVSTSKQNNYSKLCIIDINTKELKEIKDKVLADPDWYPIDLSEINALFAPSQPPKKDKPK